MIIRNAITSQRRLEDSGLLILDGNKTEIGLVAQLPDYFRRDDVLVVNDAATLPASLSGRHVRSGRDIELRLVMPLRHENYREWRAVLFGEGNWKTPTERRLLPPLVKKGDRLEFSGGLVATIEQQHEVSSRLMDVKFEDEEALAKIYSVGRPIQYSYLKEPLALWDQQTIFAGPPVALEPPSASFVLSWSMIESLRVKGVSIVSLTHGTGISDSGEKAINQLLPFPEQYRIPIETQEKILRARAFDRRVIAVGTGVVRALESWAGEKDRGEWHFTELVLSAAFDRKIVDGLLTGMHDPQASHQDLLQAFASRDRLREGYEAASRAGFLWHEYGDVSLIFG
jgi:S-adenosylmethionine:tRNA ribosyltransferase-isomerase